MRPGGPALALAALLLLTGAIYLPGLPGTFLFDDLHNITLNERVAIHDLDAESLWDAFNADANTRWPSRGIAHLSFALNHYASGGRFDPGVMKGTNIAIHLFNGVLLYLLLATVLAARAGSGATDAGPRWIAAMAAGLWLIHPLQLTAVLYAVQRMTSLAAVFVLLGLLLYCAGRSRLASRPVAGLALMATGVGGGTVLGVLAKENAILLPLFALLLELWFYSLPGRCTGPERRRLAAFHGLTLGLPALAGLAVVALHADRLLAGYAFRSYDLGERLLTQGRVLFYYLRWFVFPRGSDLSLYHDDIVVSTGAISPWTTLPALALWAGALALAAVTFRRRPLLAFCLLWFLAGQLVESTVLPLEMVFEHRNYLPLVGPCLALAWLLVRAVERGLAPVRGAAAVAVAAALVLGFVTQTRAGIWKDDYTLSYFLVRNHPESYRAKTKYAGALVTRGADAREVYDALIRAATDDARPVLSLLEMIKMTSEMRLRIEAGDIEETAPAPPSPEGLDAPLRFDRDYLARLQGLLTEELELRLAEQPLDVEAVRGLRLLHECVSLGNPTCLSLRAQTARWLLLAMDNPRSLPSTLAPVEYFYGALLAGDGRNEEAARWAAQAWEREPGELGYGYYQAFWLMRAGRLPEAARIVEHMEAVHRDTGQRGDDARRLRDAYEKARREAEAAS